MNRKIGSGLVLGVLLAAFVFTPRLVPWGTHVSECAAQEMPNMAAAAGVKTTAPDFDLPNLNGATVSLSQYRDKKAVLLYFWASWCHYCIAARPAVINLCNEIPKSEMEIISINVGSGDTLARVKKFQEANPAPFPVLYDGESKVTRSYRVEGIPLFVVIDKSGVIRYRGNMLPADPRKYLN